MQATTSTPTTFAQLEMLIVKLLPMMELETVLNVGMLVTLDSHVHTLMSPLLTLTVLAILQMEHVQHVW
jgi:hypothetical protein